MLSAFQFPSFHRIAELLLQRLHEVFGEFNLLAQQTLLGSTNETLGNAPDEREPFKHLYVNNVWLYKYDPRNKQNTRSEQAAAREKVPVLRARKQFKKTGEQSYNIQRTIPGGR